MKDSSEQDRAKPDARGRSLGWKFWLKVFVTIVLVVVITWQIEWAELVEAVRSAQLYLVASVIGLMMLSVTISAYKWQKLLAIHDVRIRLGLLHRWYFIAVFFNNFLPTSIGGDGYRIYRTLEFSKERGPAIIAIIMERVSGLVVLLTAAYVTAGVMLMHTSEELIVWFVRGVTVAGLVAVGVLTLEREYELLEWCADKTGLRSVFAAVMGRLDDFKSKPVQSGWALGGVSTLFHAHTVLFYWILFYSLGVIVDPAELLVVLAITAVVSLVPVSLNGIGVIEGAFVWAAVQFGIGYEVALAVIVIVRGIKLLQSGVGAMLYILGGKYEQAVSSTSS